MDFIGPYLSKFLVQKDKNKTLLGLKQKPASNRVNIQRLLSASLRRLHLHFPGRVLFVGNSFEGFNGGHLGAEYIISVNHQGDERLHSLSA